MNTAPGVIGRLLSGRSRMRPAIQSPGHFPSHIGYPCSDVNRAQHMEVPYDGRSLLASFIVDSAFR